MKRARHHVNPLAVQKEYSFLGFRNTKPIVIDIGSETGGFVEQLSAKFPEYNYIVCEIRSRVVEELKQKFAGRRDIAILDGDAGKNFKRILMPCIQQGATIDTVYVNFPDPWFKERHKKRRFINAQFLQEISTWFPAETCFVFQTDNQPLFEETLEVIKDSPFSDIEPFDESPFGIQTWWESRKSEAGFKIWRIRFKLKP